jgi:Asp-tRNA(Asn)/Glu-tRNA(Gln) amidotransferase A subunit family amidase
VGAQLVAPVGREDVLFGLAAQIEHELGFEQRRPGGSSV